MAGFGENAGKTDPYLNLGDLSLFPNHDCNQMDALKRLFAQNRQWSSSITAQDPDFFKRLSQQQTPEYLWIGCSDSRVTANQIVGLQPGEVFVHRNIANVVDPNDLNCSSVIQFAVDILKVRHILVVGHYGCGGVKAALHCQRVGLADKWLRHVEAVKNLHQNCLCRVPDTEEREDRLGELNVIEQVAHVCATETVQNAWARDQFLMIHGCIYGPKDGLLQDMKINVASAEEAPTVYASAVARYQTEEN